MTFIAPFAQNLGISERSRTAEATGPDGEAIELGEDTRGQESVESPRFKVTFDDTDGQRGAVEINTEWVFFSRPY